MPAILVGVGAAGERYRRAVKVGAVWRYPVKSMRGEQLREAAVGPRGLAGDRHYGVLDVASGTILSAKREGRLLQAQSVLAGSELTVRLPTGETLLGLGANVDRALSDWLGRPVHLVEAAEHGRATYENIYDFEDDASEPTSWEGPPGSFVDSSPVHLLTTSSLGVGASGRPDLQWDVRRFRPNIVVDSAEDEMVELAWSGRRVRIGEVLLDIWKGCARCVMTTRSQPGGIERQLDVLRHINAEHAALLGVLAGVSEGGRLAVGQGVSLA
ncbi:MAG TPA: MOSC N-terminal beta barrel domain-containing protein [Acidimicrobiales bacterium]|nr:MOSC N-terminal beta barrel domain-containing protein [Acidimicrobiales bacterium]